MIEDLRPPFFVEIDSTAGSGSTTSGETGFRPLRPGVFLGVGAGLSFLVLGGGAWVAGRGDFFAARSLFVRFLFLEWRSVVLDLVDHVENTVVFVEVVHRARAFA